MQFKYFLGVDVGKLKNYILLRTTTEVLWKGEVENEHAVLIKLFRTFKKEFGISSKDSLVCMEATGMYNFHMLSMIHTLNIPSWVISGQEIINSLGIRRGKSDPIDANRIADYAMRFIDKLDLWTPPRKIIETLKVLITTRSRIIKCKKELEVPVNEMELFFPALEFEMVNKLSAKPIKALEDSLRQIEKTIDELIHSDTELKASYVRLTSIKGVGKVTAVTFIAVTNEFKDFKDTKKLACHCGIAPFAYSSGKKIGQAHLSHKANKNLKTLLDLGARSAILGQGELKDYYIRKVAEGKHKTSVRNAVQYKILSRMMAVERNKTMYEKNYSYALA